MKAMLERGWFEGFDHNQILDLDLPEMYDLSKTTTSLPLDYSQDTFFEYSYFTGPLDDNLLGENVKGINSSNFISTGPGYDYVHAGSGDDLVFGDSGNDRLKGQKGDDNLRGGSGDDTLRGGKGNDVIISGTGHDIIAMSKGLDVVKDFSLDKDVIQLNDQSSLVVLKQQEDHLLITEYADESTRKMLLEHTSLEAFELMDPLV